MLSVEDFLQVSVSCIYWLLIQSIIVLQIFHSTWILLWEIPSSFSNMWPILQLMYVAATIAMDSQHCITIEHIALDYIFVVPGRLGSYWYIKTYTLFVLARGILSELIFLNNILWMKHPQLIFIIYIRLLHRNNLED